MHYYGHIVIEQSDPDYLNDENDWAMIFVILDNIRSDYERISIIILMIITSLLPV